MKELRLIKNLKSEHLEEFKSKGRVLITSFSRCRDLDGHAGDPLEGISGFQLTSNDYVTLDKEQQSVPDVIFQEPNRVKNLNVRYKIPDAYLFCVSSKVIPSYESHYTINKPLSFGTILYRTLLLFDKEIYFWKLESVIYGGLKDPITDPEVLKQIDGSQFKQATRNDYFMKPSTFADDEEYRFVFFTRSRKVRDCTYIINKKLIKYCSFD